MKLIVGLLACGLVGSSVHAQTVQWPEKKARAADAAALFQTATKLRAELAEETNALGPAHGAAATCIEQLSNATSADLGEIRQTYRLAIVDAYMADPVDEESASGILFDALAEAKFTLQKTHAVVQLVQALCPTDTGVQSLAIDLEALEGAYGQTIATLQERIGSSRPGPPTPSP